MPRHRPVVSAALSSALIATLATFALITLSTGCATVAPLPPTETATDSDAEIPPYDEGREDGEIPPRKIIVTYDPPTTPDLTDSDEGTNVRANQDSSGRNQNETTVAIHPDDPTNLIGGANDAREGSYAAGVYVSQDGGASWTDGLMPFRKYPNQGDPTLAFCGDGTAVYGYLDYTAAYQPHRLIVGRSDDGGQSWQGPGVLHEGSIPFADKPYIACAPDDGSFYANRAYMSWTHFSFGSSPIRVAYSSDRGLSWQGATNISGSGVQGSIPVAGRDGEVFVFWLGSGLRFARSTNGGQTWGPDTLVTGVDSIGDSPFFRRNSFPTAGIDVSGGEHDGNVYVAWSDASLGDPDIVFTRSTDGGDTWSPLLRVNDDPVGNGRDQFFPWMAVDENGLVHLMWHDQRGDADNRRFHVYVATSRDGGQTFDRNLRVTDEISDGSLTGFLGDYAALAARHGKLVPLWSDLRGGTGEQDVYSEVETVFDYDIVAEVRFLEDRETLVFVDQEPRLGASIRYDVVRGNVADLAAGSPWANASCAVEDTFDPSASVPGNPLPGQAEYVIVRAQGPRGTGSFGSGSDHPDPRDGYDDAPPCE